MKSKINMYINKNYKKLCRILITIAVILGFELVVLFTLYTISILHESSTKTTQTHYNNTSNEVINLYYKNTNDDSNNLIKTLQITSEDSNII